MMGAPEQFDWKDDECILVREQPSVAVYINNWSGAVIRAERAWDQDDDTVIVLATADAAEHVGRALLESAAMVREKQPQLIDLEASATKDATAAARQRRHRNKHRPEGPYADLDHSTLDTPTTELCGVLYGAEGPDRVTPDRDGHRDKDRDVTRDSHAVTLFERHDAAVTSPAVAA